MKTLALFVIVCLTIVNSRGEVCEKKNKFHKTYELKNCSMYCCGSCNLRYCCSDPNKRLDQKLCDPEDCLPYYVLQEYNEPVKCSGRFFCCGSCYNRYCCSNMFFRLNQSSCANKEPTNSTATGYLAFLSKRKSNRVISWLWLILIDIILILCYFLWRNWNASRSHRQLVTNNAINNSSNINRTYYNQQQNNTNTSSAAEHLISNAQSSTSNTNVYDDLPPSYASLMIKDKKTEETVEANANNQ